MFRGQRLPDSATVMEECSGDLRERGRGETGAPGAAGDPVKTSRKAESAWCFPATLSQSVAVVGSSALTQITQLLHRKGKCSYEAA